ncbi:M20 family metallopeptidase [Calidifontibacillus erzurumensis]|uniref:Amidohydrolase n=1 Tax=Calidifontibacillus erzurumensis TaxID=2741433 RepID=A0A8J8GF37_9BACI|nr:M20 family metallopeptidase [Calidifontibacillus erzurumensis]NSL50653.1 amidohydrolase [Calidifontibacillus erzurumensis]
MEDLYHTLDSLYREMVEIRRYLHQHPELSFEEVETPKFIAEYHRNLGNEVRTQVGGRGVVAILKGKRPGPTVALRADFDALPIQEENDVPYKSKFPGKMHACGHDGHTATLLVLAKAFQSIKETIAGNIVFIHQHAEEVAPGGAIAMIEDGCLEGVDVIFGTHLWSTIPLGDITYRPGPFMAAADKFEIKIQGKGGHGALPHLSKDSIVIGSQLVLNLQQIVSRRVDPLEPAVLSIGSFVAENAHNIIADSVFMAGTVRTMNEKTRNFIEKEIDRIVNGVCSASDATYTYTYNKGYPPVMNHADQCEFLARIAQNVPDVVNVYETPPIMGGEDFAYYLQHVKGVFFFTGAMNPDWEIVYPHHHPKFDIDERAMLIAAKTLGSLAVNYMKKS